MPPSCHKDTALRYINEALLWEFPPDGQVGWRVRPGDVQHGKPPDATVRRSQAVLTDSKGWVHLSPSVSYPCTYVLHQNLQQVGYHELDVVSSK